MTINKELIGSMIIFAYKIERFALVEELLILYKELEASCGFSFDKGVELSVVT